MRFIADALTVLRVLASIIVLAAGLTGHWSTATLVFIIGILSDAFDGPAARRWPYSDEENGRLPWRKDPHAFDNAADLVLSTCGLIVVTFGLLPFWLAVPAFLAVPALSGVLLVLLERAARSGRPKLAELVDVIHGWVFGFELFLMLVIMTAQIVDQWRIPFTLYVVCLAGIVLWKWDRVTSRPEVDYSR